MSALASFSSLAEFALGSPSTTDLDASTTAANIGPYCVEGIVINGAAFGIDYPYPIAASSEIWLKCSWRCNSTAWGSGSRAFLFSGPTSELFRLRGTTNEDVTWEYYNGSGWTTIATVTTPNPNVLYEFMFHILLDNSVGVAEFYVNGTLEASLAGGDTIFTSDTTIDTVSFGTVAGGSFTTISAVMIADEDLSDWVFSQTNIDGNGTYTAWTNDYTAVDEAGFNDTDTVFSSNNGDVETFTFGNLSTDFSSGWDVVALVVTPRAAKGASGPGYVKPVCYSGTTLGEGSSKALELTYAPLPHIFTQDPDAVAAWTYSTINSAEIGVKASTT